jgi:hypothetical protein
MNCETLGENIEPDTVEKCGCLSHPDARAWLMRDVIKELTNQINMLENLEPDRGSENWCAMQAYKRAISLIKTGVE